MLAPYHLKPVTRPLRSGCMKFVSPLSRPVSATQMVTPAPSKPSCCVTVGVATCPSSPPTSLAAASSTNLRRGARSIQSTELDCASASRLAGGKCPRKKVPWRKRLSCAMAENSERTWAISAGVAWGESKTVTSTTWLVCGVARAAAASRG